LPRTGSFARMQELGAVPIGDERVTFRVWAPEARSLVVRTGGRDEPPARAADGTWPAAVAAKPGDEHVFVVDREA